MPPLPSSFHRGARAEFRNAVRWYRARSTSAADAFVAAVEEAVRAIEDNPEAWARRGRRSDVRAFPLDRYPYSIVYRVRPTLIRVLAVAHARRRPDYWEGRR